MSNLATTLTELAEQFNALHTTKEDLFWAAKMGLTDDPAATQRALGEAEIAVNRFLQDPAKLKALRAMEGQGTPAEHRVLKGWIALFAANTIERPEARK